MKTSRMNAARFVLGLAFGVCVLVNSAFAGYITEDLQALMATVKPAETLPVIVYFNEQADPAKLVDLDNGSRYRAICDLAKRTQAPVTKLLSAKSSVSDLKQYTVVNAISAKMDVWTIQEIAARPDIGFVMHDAYVKALFPNENRQILGTFAPGGDQIPWNISIMGAPRAWDLGYRGDGVIIGVMDTGADIMHPGLRSAYRQYRNQTGTKDTFSWYSSHAYANTRPTPFDDNGHGTGTAGFVASQFNMGIAPNCKIIICKVMDSSGGGANSQFVAGFNWFFNLPDSFRPKAVSNSWGYSTGNDTLFWTCCLNWKTIGILPVFSNGNEGDAGAGSVGRPGKLPTVLGVGATDNNDELLYYSSLGPAPNVNPINNNTYWYRTDWNRHKPEVCAPAEPTTTTAVGNSWQSFSGTSASCPHVGGQVAVLLSKNPALTPTELYNIITNNTVLPQAYFRTFPNDSFGWGRADVFRALQAVPEPTTPHIIIQSVVVKDSVAGCDNDGELDPNEVNVGVPIRVTLKNLGAPATACSLKILNKDHAQSAIVGANWAQFGAIARNGTSTVTLGGAVSKPRLQAAFPDTTYANFQVEIRANNSVYKRFDVLSFYVPYQNKPTVIDTFILDAGTHTYNLANDAAAYDADNYFAMKFTVAAACSVTGVIWYMDGTITGPESVFVWADNAGRPGARLGFTTVATISNKAWQTVTLPQAIWNPNPGDIWFGVRKVTNAGCVPCQDNGLRANYVNMSSITSAVGTWRQGTYWYDFEMRPIIKQNPVTAPVVRWNEEDHIDDAQYGNNDGGIDPGELVNVSFAFKNYGIAVHNITGKIRPADAVTSARITVLDSVATFGSIQNGFDGGNNFSDPYQIRMWDGDTLTGEDFNFKMIVNGNYGTNNGTSYADSFTVTVAGPWAPQPGDTLFYPMGFDGLYILSSYMAPGTFASYCEVGNMPTDSVYVDSMYIFGYNDGAAKVQTNFYIWDVNPTTWLPNNILVNHDAGKLAAGYSAWVSVPVKKKIPGIFYFGQNCTANGGTGLQPIWWWEPFIGLETYYNSAGQTSAWTAANVQYFGPPIIAAYMDIRHDHPALSYYRPSGMDWPIVPSHTSGGSDVLPATLSGTQPTYIKDFTAANRSSINISVPSYFDDYLFLDNFALAKDSANALTGWNYRTAVTSGVNIPGGRHTLFSSLDWNNEVTGNVFNVYLRNWGKQYTWTPASATATSKTVMPPMQTGVAAGPYDNCVALACTLKSKTVADWGSKWWHGFGIRPKNFTKTQDSIDMDLLLFSDAPSSPYTGYTNIKEASLLGPTQVDFMVANHRQIGTNPYVLYMGAYTYSDCFDSLYMDFAPPVKGLTFGGALADTINVTDSDVINLYEVALSAGAQTITCDVFSGTIDVGLALFAPSSDGDYYKQRSAALATVDAAGSGADEALSFTAATADTYALVIFSNGSGSKAKASGSFRITGISGKSSPLSALAVSFSSMNASVSAQGITITWRTESESNTYQWRIERATTASGPYQQRGVVDAAGNSSVPKDYRFVDPQYAGEQEYYYRLAQIDLDQSITYYGPIKIGPFASKPVTFDLLPAMPNPTRGPVSISYQLPKRQHASLQIYNITGALVKTLVDGDLEPGYYRSDWDGRDNAGKSVSSGIYFYRLQAESGNKTGKLTVIR